MLKRKLKIVIFHLAFIYSGGGEKLVLEEIKGLQSRGHLVECFTPTMNKKLCFPDIISQYPIKTFIPGFSKIFPWQESLKILVTCIFFPLVAKRFKKYDVVIGANQPGPWLSWIIKKATGRPYLIYLAQPTRILYPRKIDLEHGVWVERKVHILPFLVNVFKPLIYIIDKVSIQGADAILVNGKYVGGLIRKIYNKTVIICPSGAYPTEKIARDRWNGIVKIDRFRIKKPYLLITNRHFPQKKFEYVISIMPEIIKKQKDIKLIITGNPTSYTKYLKSMVKDLAISEYVIFSDYVKENDLKKLYRNAAVYVYTSPEEDFGMGVVESMAQGVPVVAWNKGGPSTTIIDGETGFLIKPYSKNDLKDKIIWLLKNRKRNYKMGSYAINLIKEKYTYKSHIDIFEKNLLEIAK
jgi:glycosyltransferase involved in cell wall biosynthesis